MICGECYALDMDHLVTHVSYHDFHKVDDRVSPLGELTRPRLHKRWIQLEFSF